MINKLLKKTLRSMVAYLYIVQYIFFKRGVTLYFDENQNHIFDKLCQKKLKNSVVTYKSN